MTILANVRELERGQGDRKANRWTDGWKDGHTDRRTGKTNS